MTGKIFLNIVHIAKAKANQEMPDSQLVDQLRRYLRLFVKVDAHAKEVRRIALTFPK
ncbi:MAG: hypothetical protein IBX43_09905 [Campylobacterales bacterium]|nr:hypothetical protein [Campylobacterales bacterium]